MGTTTFEEITTGRGEDLVTLTRWVIAQQQVNIYIFIFIFLLLLLCFFPLDQLSLSIIGIICIKQDKKKVK